ncbi:hypothetical protein ACFIJ5_10815 [Haloimpatiens sp. FM7330]
MEYDIELLDTEYRLLGEKKYKDKLSLERIGLKLSMDKSKVSRNSSKVSY